MRRFLRLLILWLVIPALTIQGAAAATAMPGHASAPSHAMTMTEGASAMPCHAHAHAHSIDKAGCGACCGPLVTQQAMLAVAPVADHWAALPRLSIDAAASLFLTGGTDRPPRPILA